MRAVLPATYSALEYELIMRHPSSFVGASPDFAALGRLRALEIQAFFDIPHSTWGAPTRILTGDVEDSTQISSICTSPDVPPQYCDARLSHLDITLWTTVPVTNEFASGAISLYLRTDQPILGFIDADLFIGDLVAGNNRFASPLLVNALLYWACVSCGNMEPRVKD